MTGIRKSIHLRLYGKAYLEDAREDLERFADDTATPSFEDWRRKDRLIQEACDKIAVIAKLDGYECIVTREEPI